MSEQNFEYSGQGGGGLVCNTKAGESAEEPAMTLDFGFDSLEIPWDVVQIWDFDGMNPCQLYNNKVQYGVAFSCKKFNSLAQGNGAQVRTYGNQQRIMWQVSKEVFTYICKLNGKEDKIATWESTAKPYVAPTPAPATTTVAKADLPI